ncbi:MAG: hypothetical protein AVDCRST_MAG88-2050 [uncultured Thermomicrobiales bacterium]|uniref:Uncharacterized protein n=1 Tax=uncultured Thermomicrobiales bacterium TaxID=1645740 RepID=A0A6J4V397_9BACT|nr:MAG: hypothetical protein AVDCRST_MAG88-2050 [uncultured Thermomicrobiales bacterium]
MPSAPTGRCALPQQRARRGTAPGAHGARAQTRGERQPSPIPAQGAEDQRPASRPIPMFAIAVRATVAHDGLDALLS